jgi:hypothetical protein
MKTLAPQRQAAGRVTARTSRRRVVLVAANAGDVPAGAFECFKAVRLAAAPSHTP